MLTILEFSQAIGKSERQVRRYITQGRLKVVESPLGQRIPTKEVSIWTDSARPEPGVLGHELDKARLTPESARPEPGVLGHEPLLKALEVANLALKRANALEKRLDEVTQFADRERRRNDALNAELNSYRRALAESAESLAEQRAATMEERSKRIAEAQQAEIVGSELESLKIDTPTPTKSWGHRLKRWIGIRTGT